MNEIEVWANIKDYNDYQVSNLGRICSYKNNSQTIINGWISNTGYLTVSLNNKKYSVHRLVAQTFIHQPLNKNVVNHKNGNKLDNRVENLEWCTDKENKQHAYRTGLMDNAIQKRIGNKNRSRQINCYSLDGVYVKSFLDSIEAQNCLRNQGINVNARNIRNVCNGKRNKAGGFIWRYVDE